ncbi:MAG TPA: T9SS type A sorting domain-containing protein [Flavihumibacter sp.]|nr:T9SS type A sorting domain-containing protein [Flavihumibacter sp.]
MVDIDGNYRYSATVLVKFNSAATAIWPTLLHAGETLYVQPGTDLQLNASLQVMDGSGRIILHQKTNNQSVISIQTGQWNAGIYIVKLQSGTEQTINKIVIQP